MRGIANRQDYYNEVWLGNVQGHSIIQKFGRNEAIPTTITPVTISGNYRTPMAAVNLEVISDDVNDAANGTGARNAILIGLNANGELLTEELATNGTNPSAATNNRFLRLFRIKVTKSGTYASQAASGQAGTLTIRESGAGDTWAVIDEVGTDFGVGQSQIGAYTIPLNHTGILLSKFVSVETTKSINAYFFQRPNINVVTAPFEGMRLVEQETGIVDTMTRQPRAAINIFSALTDIGFMAKAQLNTAAVSCDFEIELIHNDYL